MTRHLSVFEHGSLSIGQDDGEGLTESEADVVSRIGEMRRGFCDRGYGEVRFHQYCGVIGLGARALEILPKVEETPNREQGRSLLLNMLQKAAAIPGARVRSAGQGTSSYPLLEVFIAAFFETVFSIVKGGLLRKYHARTDDLNVVRGRIAARRQFGALFNRADVIACEFDELTPNSIWNRVLKAAIRILRPWISSPHISRQWIELMIVFDEVEDVQVTRRMLDALIFDRHALRYRTAITWARWILAELSPDLRAGGHEAPALLFDMNLVFQAAVANELQRALPTGTDLWVQDTGRYLATVAQSGQPVLGLRPDIVLSRNGRVVTVADTKWKVLEPSDGTIVASAADVYQMLAYSAAYQCADLVLLVPWHPALPPGLMSELTLPSLGNLKPRLRIESVDVASDSWDLGFSRQPPRDRGVGLGGSPPAN